ncbi:MAG: hypothetical protein WCI11_05670 [Candidatus Methylumidiphilus sp.]
MIETPLAILPFDCESQEVCDWFELYTLSSEYYAAGFHELARAWDKRKISEDTDFEGNSAESQEFLDGVCQEIQSRMDKLSECYPFQFSDTDEELIFLNDALNDGSKIYVFCLFISHINNKVIFDNPSFYVIDNRVRSLFQACATWAAAGLVKGHSYSFGFPRHDHSGFLKKLAIIYQNFGDGRVRQTSPPGVSKSPKDEEIDVIAWHPRADFSPGTYYILGQAASGDDWRNKSIKGAIEAFHSNWFGMQPASTPTPAIFIPFNITPVQRENISDWLWVLTNRFGDIYYRLLIPTLARKGLELSQSHKNLAIERVEDITELSNWLKQVINDFREACVYS